MLGYVFYPLRVILSAGGPATRFAFLTIWTDLSFMQKPKEHNPIPLLYWEALFATWNVWVFLHETNQETIEVDVTGKGVTFNPWRQKWMSFNTQGETPVGQYILIFIKCWYY